METKKFRKKPVDVEAVKITDENFGEVVRWLKDHDLVASFYERFCSGEHQTWVVQWRRSGQEEYNEAVVGNWIVKTQGKTTAFFARSTDKSIRNHYEPMEEVATACTGKP